MGGEKLGLQSSGNEFIVLGEPVSAITKFQMKADERR